MNNTLVAVVGAISLVLLFSFLLCLPVMWLWNSCLVGAIDGVHEVSWFQAWGITLLCGFLFKSGVSTK